MSSFIFLPGQAPASNRDVLDAMLDLHASDIVRSIAEAIAFGGPEIGTTHVAIAVACTTAAGRRFMARATAASIVPRGHVFATGMPTLIAKVATAVTMFHPPVAAHIRRLARSGHIHVLAVGDNDHDNPCCRRDGSDCMGVIATEWPLPELRLAPLAQVST